MEPHAGASAARSIGKTLFALCLAAVAGAFYLHFNSDTLRLLRAGKPVDLAVFTQPPLFASYNPADSRASVSFIDSQTALSGTFAQKAASIKSKLAKPEYAWTESLYIAPPGEPLRRQFLELSKNWIISWQANPLSVISYAAAYYKLRRQRDCNISASEFLVLSLEFLRMGISDFSVAADERGGSQTDEVAGPATQKPLVVEILNATGRKNTALEATKFLRNLNDRNELKIDVLRYDNYSVKQPKSRIISHTGRFEEVVQMARALGLPATEIYTQKHQIGSTDATVILGEDFIPQPGGLPAAEMLH